MELSVKSFLKTSLLLLTMVILAFGVLGYSVFFLSAKYYNTVIIGITSTLFLLLIFSVLTIYLLVRTFKNKYLSGYLHPFIKVFTVISYPFLRITAKLTNTDRDQLKAFFIDINNILVLSMRYKVNPSKVLILTPHCLQDSNCQIKITNDSNNCKRCGKCCVKDLLELSGKYGSKFYVASGGTFARKIIKDTKPKFIVAIACERDLLSGINDVKSIPVIGVVNERPNGPCFNTRVDIEKVEKTIMDIIY